MAALDRSIDETVPFAQEIVKPSVTLGGLLEASSHIALLTHRYGLKPVGKHIVKPGIIGAYKAAVKGLNMPVWHAMIYAATIATVGNVAGAVKVPGLNDMVEGAKADIVQNFQQDVSNAERPATLQQMKESLVPDDLLQAQNAQAIVAQIFNGISDEAVVRLYGKVQQIHTDTAKDRSIAWDFYYLDPGVNGLKKDIQAKIPLPIMRPYSPRHITATRSNKNLSPAANVALGAILTANDTEGQQIYQNMLAAIQQGTQIHADLNTPDLRNVEQALMRYFGGLEGYQYRVESTQSADFYVNAVSAAQDLATNATLAKQAMPVVKAIDYLQHQSILFVPGRSLSPDVAQGMIVGSKVAEIPYAAMFGMNTESGLRAGIHAGKTMYQSSADGLGQMTDSTWLDLWRRRGPEIINRLEVLQETEANAALYTQTLQEVRALTAMLKSGNMHGFDQQRGNARLNGVATAILLEDNVSVVKRAFAEDLMHAEKQMDIGAAPGTYDRAARNAGYLNELLGKGAVYILAHKIGATPVIELIKFHMEHPQEAKTQPAAQVLMRIASPAQRAMYNRIIKNNPGVFRNFTFDKMIEQFDNAIPEPTAHELLRTAEAGQLWREDMGAVASVSAAAYNGGGGVSKRPSIQPVRHAWNTPKA